MVPLRLLLGLIALPSLLLAHGGSHEMTAVPASNRIAEFRIPAAPTQIAQGCMPYGLSDPLVALTQPALLGGLPEGWSSAVAGSGLRGHPTFGVAAGWTGVEPTGERIGFGIGATGLSFQEAADVSESDGIPPRADYAAIAGSYQRGIIAAGAVLRLSSREFAAARDTWHAIGDGAEKSIDIGLALHMRRMQVAASYEALGAQTVASAVRLGYAVYFNRPDRSFPIHRFSSFITFPTQGRWGGSLGFGATRRETWLMPDMEWSIGYCRDDFLHAVSAGISTGVGRIRPGIAWTASKPIGYGSTSHAIHLGLTLMPARPAPQTPPN